MTDHPIRPAATERAAQAPAEADTCRPVEVDGETIRVRGSGEFTEQEQGVFAEIVRAAKRRYAADQAEAALATAKEHPLTGHPIRAGQVYRACDPRDNGRRIRILSYSPGADRAQIVDAVTGKRQRQIYVDYLHDSPTTRDGQPRRTGYALEQP